MIKVTYYIYSCDTCCMIKEKVKINGLNCAMCQIVKLRDTMRIMEMFNRNKTKKLNSFLLQIK